MRKNTIIGLFLIILGMFMLGMGVGVTVTSDVMRRELNKEHTEAILGIKKMLQYEELKDKCR